MNIPIIYNLNGEINNNPILEYLERKKNPFLYRSKPEGFHSRRGTKSNPNHHSTVVKLNHRKSSRAKKTIQDKLSGGFPDSLI